MRQISVALLLAWSFAAALRVAHGADQSAASPDAVEFSVGKDGRLILLPVQLGPRKMHCLLDTGSSISGFDISLRDMLGRPTGTIPLETPAGRQRVETFAWPDARLGDEALKSNQSVMGVDLKRAREASGEDVFGVLGMDVLGTRQLQIDFDRGVVRFLNSLAADADELGDKVSLTFARNGVPILSASAGREPAESFRIDTGAHNNALQDTRFDELVELKLLRPGAPYASVTAAGELRGKAGRLANFTLGPFAHRDLRFERVNQSAVGLRYLSRFQVTFDFPAKTAYFKKGSHFADADPSATSGVSLVRVDGQTVVDSVIKGGPAERAGLKPNDVLVRINDRPAAEFDFYLLRQLLTSEVGRKIRLTIRRKVEELRLEVSLVEN